VPVASTLAAGCAATGRAVGPEEAIPAQLDAQAAAWNAGDVEGFMRGYWQSPELTFSSGGTVTRGWEPTLARYKQRYPDRAAMGHLTFSDLDIVMLGRDAALVLGRWRLERDKPVGGNYTLVLRRIGGQWLIIHDHTSKDQG
jgi:beta-aspartyl-peptidase (threonine type)